MAATSFDSQQCEGKKKGENETPNTNQVHSSTCKRRFSMFFILISSVQDVDSPARHIPIGSPTNCQRAPSALELRSGGYVAAAECLGSGF